MVAPVAERGLLLRVRLQALRDLPQSAVLGQRQHQVDLWRLGQLIQNHLGQPTVRPVLIVFHRNLTEGTDQLAQQIADPQHMTARRRPRRDAAIDVQAAHFRARRTEHPVRHARRNPHGTLRRGHETPDAGLYFEHARNRIGKLHPRVAVAPGQGAIGQRFGTAVERSWQAGQPGNTASNTLVMSFRRHRLAHRR
ncbi:hypothetical protein D3C85_1011990 [compost metagenome]